jgi:AraC-like DNA-binding protein
MVLKMAAKIEFDCRDIAQELRRGALIRGVDVYRDFFEPKEGFVGGSLYLARQSGIVSYAFNFSAKKPHQHSYARGDWLTIVFMISGALDARDPVAVHQVPPGTIWISGSPWSQAYVDPNPRLIAGHVLWIERQRLIDVFGLQVDNIPEPYRPIFTTGADGILDIELPMPPSAWAAVQEIQQCGYPEPLRAEYESAKAVELTCYVVAELNKLRPSSSGIGVSGAMRERAGIETAAYIYRYQMSRPPSLDEVARRVGMNRNKLVAGFRERFGATPHDYSRQIRLDRAQEMLRGGALSIEQIAVACGYTSHAAFTRSFRQRYGFSPSQAGGQEPGFQFSRISHHTPRSGVAASLGLRRPAVQCAGELALVAVTRPPELERQSLDALKAAARRLREAHDRAKGIGTRQAREMRGKAEPHGAKPARDNLGTVAQGAGFARRARSGRGGAATPRGGAALRGSKLDRSH